MSGLIISAPASASGKTTVTLGLLRAIKRRGVAISVGKAGPDFIDPQFHTIAANSQCYNFDPWAMRQCLLKQQSTDFQDHQQLLIIEAMMGLFDGASDGKGSAADLARLLELAIILVVDCSKMSHSIAALVEGFRNFRQDINIAGVILNKVGSARHDKMLRDALAPFDIAVIGTLAKDDLLVLPERHLGLVQAGEHEQIETFIEIAADKVEQSLDIDLVIRLSAKASQSPLGVTARPLKPIGQNIAIAKDLAFSFIYPHLLEGWRSQGAEISFFSPLANEGPCDIHDAVYLPGGYPELHAGTISHADNFQKKMKIARDKSVKIYGECGGYMVLGEGLITINGARHEMLGMLPVDTSFITPERHLGYRRLSPCEGFVFDRNLRAHEFHYSSEKCHGKKRHGEKYHGEKYHGDVKPLFHAKDALGKEIGPVGTRVGNVAGSYMHIIDQVN